MNLNIKNIDNTKTNLGLRHNYVPKTAFNMKQKEEDRITVDCEYLKVGEKMNYTTVGKDGEASVDITALFRHKVFGIKNLEINGEPVTSADSLLKYPGVIELEALVIDVSAHILNTETLNEDERKN